MANEIEINLNVTLRDSFEDHFDVKKVIMGDAPVVYILPTVDEYGKMEINVDATDFGTQDDLADFLNVVADILKGNPL